MEFRWEALGRKGSDNPGQVISRTGPTMSLLCVHSRGFQPKENTVHIQEWAPGMERKVLEKSSGPHPNNETEDP